MLKEEDEYRRDILATGFFRGFIDGENYMSSTLICKTGIEYRFGTNKQP